jgi:regulator of protease activity HflC (stomatin/prohibitin superfamily)
VEDLIRLIVIAAVVVGIGAAVVLVGQRLIGRVTIHEYERGLRFEGGRFVGLLDTGAHTWFRLTTEVLVIDSRPRATTVEGQEVMTADGVAVKISLVVRSAVGDPVARLHADQDADQLLYLLVQLALRDVIAGRDLVDVLATRATLGPAMLERVATRMGEIGIELLSIDVRDVMVSAELKRAMGAVAAARHEGAASLERARSENATLRSLANAGRVLDDNPALLSLRLVQELTDRGGNTVVLGLPDGGSVGPSSRAVTGRRATDRTARRSGQTSETTGTD